MTSESIIEEVFKVRWISKLEGGNLPLLFHVNPCIPVRLPFHYMTLHAEEKYAESSQGQIARTLKALYQYSYVVAGIDLDTILSNGQTLGTDEILGFARWLRNGRQNPVNLIGRIGLANEADDIIARDTVVDYLSQTKQYLIWAADTYRATGCSEAEVRTQFEAAKELIERLFRRFKRPRKALLMKGLDKDRMHRLRLVARPGSHLNPFRGEAVQYRNWCILELLYATGMRRGELLAAYSSDRPSIHNDHKWEVRRRPADVLDTRNPRPAIKTKERDILLLPRHTDLLKKYVDKYRFVITFDESGTQKKRKPLHDFLFISTDDGAPLSLDVINKMFTNLAEVAFPDGDVALHPHLLRNTFCNEFMEHAVDVEGRSVESAMEDLRRICGWSLKSTMPALYAAKWMQDAADNAQRSVLLKREERDMA